MEMWPVTSTDRNGHRKKSLISENVQAKNIYLRKCYCSSKWQIKIGYVLAVVVLTQKKIEI